MGKPTTVTEYFSALSEERKAPMEQLRASISTNLPSGYEEVLNYGMPSWVVPHAIYKAGYHANPKLPLPFLSIASQKSHVAVYHMGLYASPPLMDWFVRGWPNHCSKKLDMGKSCIRFKKTADIPYELIGALCQKMTVQEWIDVYEQGIKR